MKRITFIAVVVCIVFGATSCAVWRGPHPMAGPGHVPHGHKAPPTAKMPRPARHEPPIRERIDPRGLYTRDARNVYYQGKKVAKASVSSFVDLGSGYGKDMVNVYYQGRRIKALSSSFVNLGRGYARDAKNVYYFGKIVRGASPDSFRTPRR